MQLFIFQKLAKSPKGVSALPKICPKYGRLTQRTTSIRFLTSILSIVCLNLSIGGFLVGGVGCGCHNTVILNSASGGSTHNIT